MAFFICTGHGNSTVSYSCVTHPSSNPHYTHPFQGLCQGNGAGPACVLSVISPCVEVLKKHGHVARFCFAILATVFCLAAFIYVNDMDLVEIANNEWETIYIDGKPSTL
jgi:hypothetical protein